MSTNSAVPAIDVDALIAAPEKREPNYRVPADAARVPFGDHALTIGVSTRGAVKGTPHLVLVNGAQQSGFPKSAIALAIMEGLISREEIAALHAAADKRAASK